MEEKSTTFGSRLASLGKAAAQETQRYAHLAALKAKIEKLKMVDVHKAQYALGRKAYELRIAAERFGAEYDEIAAIEKNIAVKRTGVPVDHSASNMELLRGAAVSAKMKAEAEALHLKLKQMLVTLGGNVEGIGDAAGLEAEITAAQAVHSQVKQLEHEYATYSSDHSAQGELKSLSASIARDADAKSRELWGSASFSLTKKQKKWILIVGISLVLLVIVFLVLAGLAFFGMGDAAEKLNNTWGKTH